MTNAMQFTCLVLVGIIISWVPTANAQYLVEALSQYEFPDLPEGIALDQDGNIYTSMVLTGEIRQRAPNGTESPLAVLPVSPLGLDVDGAGNVFAALYSNWPLEESPPDPDTQGVWQIEPNGAAERLAALPVDGWPNDVAIGTSGNLFVSDSLLGKVYRISPDGTVEDWVVDPLLLPDPDTPFPAPIGANGIAFAGSDLFINNLTVGSIVRVPVQPDGSAGVPAVAFSDPLLFGADGLAADGQGNLYVANVIQDTILRVAPEGAIDILADIGDGLDDPTSLELMDQDVFFVNSGLLTFNEGGTPVPSLMRIVIPEPSTLVSTAWRKIFRDERDYGRFFEGLEAIIDKFRFGLFGFVCMPNHAHLFFRTPEPNLSRGMQYLLSGYANWFNTRQRRPGHLFQGRFKGELIEDDRHFWNVSRYLHLNPVRGKRPLVERPEDWPWSSYPGNRWKKRRVSWVAYEELYRAWETEHAGGARAEAAYRRYVDGGVVKPPANPLANAVVPTASSPP